VIPPSPTRLFHASLPWGLFARHLSLTIVLVHRSLSRSSEKENDYENKNENDSIALVGADVVFAADEVLAAYSVFRKACPELLPIAWNVHVSVALSFPASRHPGGASARRNFPAPLDPYLLSIPDRPVTGNPLIVAGRRRRRRLFGTRWWGRLSNHNWRGRWSRSRRHRHRRGVLDNGRRRRLNDDRPPAAAIKQQGN
jgi:hypothetical protein